MFDILSFGELLIDFTESGYSEYGMRLFEQNAGGAVANCAAAVARLGGSAAVMGKVGCDMHGAFLIKTLLDAGIDVTGVISDVSVFTTLAFVALSENGAREFSFARKPGADTCFRVSELNDALLTNTKIFHVGSLSLTDEPSKSATYEAVKRAKSAGAIISYDPNYRASLWPGKAAAIEGMRSLLPYADIMKLSDEELELLTDIADPEKAAKRLIESGLKIVAVTMGPDGAYVLTKDGGSYVKTFDDKPVDTTGAGDAFWGGFIYAFTRTGKRPEEITPSEAASFALVGNAAASLCVTKRGGIPAMHDWAAVEKRMAGK